MIHDESTSKIPAVSRATRQDASLSARLGLPSPPIFLRFAFHCRRIRILAFDPVARAAGRIRGIATLDTMPSSPSLQAWWNTSVLKVLVQTQARSCSRGYPGELVLRAPTGS